VLSIYREVHGNNHPFTKSVKASLEKIKND
jgi:hypothetical protein